jgi:phospholipid/cholesterol/gamma-HCH transport system permease protein
VLGTVAGRSWLPVRGFVVEVGDIALLAVSTIVKALTPPYNYGPELADQFWFALRLAWFPMLLTSVGLSFGPAGIQTIGILKLFGAADRLGGVFALVVVREFAPLVCAIVMAGVAGTAITADLGARKIREELDALAVMGVDPIKSLVVPRFLSLVLITALFDIYALIFGTAGGVLVALVNHQPLGPFFTTYLTVATPLELGASLLKTALYGGIIAIVCCYKGLTASGGPEGVGRAVNQAVVIAMLAIGAFDYVFTQALLATHPSLSAIK